MHHIYLCFPSFFTQLRKWQEALDLLRNMLQQSLPVDGITLGAAVGAVRRQRGEQAAVEQLKAICGSGGASSAEMDGIKDSTAVSTALVLEWGDWRLWGV